MFAPPVAKENTKPAPSPTPKLSPDRSTPVAQLLSGGALAQSTYARPAGSAPPLVGLKDDVDTSAGRTGTSLSPAQPANSSRPSSAKTARPRTESGSRAVHTSSPSRRRCTARSPNPAILSNRRRSHISRRSLATIFPAHSCTPTTALRNPRSRSPREPTPWAGISSSLVARMRPQPRERPLPSRPRTGSRDPAKPRRLGRIRRRSSKHGRRGGSHGRSRRRRPSGRGRRQQRGRHRAPVDVRSILRGQVQLDLPATRTHARAAGHHHRQRHQRPHVGRT